MTHRCRARRSDTLAVAGLFFLLCVPWLTGATPTAEARMLHTVDLDGIPHVFLDSLAVALGALTGRSASDFINDDYHALPAKRYRPMAQRQL